MSTVNKTQTELLFFFLWACSPSGNIQSYLDTYNTLNLNLKVSCVAYSKSKLLSCVCGYFITPVSVSLQFPVRCPLFKISRAWCSLPLSLRLVSSSSQWFQTPEWDIHNSSILWRNLGVCTDVAFVDNDGCSHQGYCHGRLNYITFKLFFVLFKANVTMRCGICRGNGHVSDTRGDSSIQFITWHWKLICLIIDHLYCCRIIICFQFLRSFEC